MATPGERSSTKLTRRAYLSGVTLTTAASAGCVRQARSVVNRASPAQISFEIKTAPADEDPAAVLLARHLNNNLEKVGANSEVFPMTQDELYRDILINHDFDMAVLQHHGGSNPDFLRPLLHSRFSEEPGWQNPFGFADLTIDELLDAQVQQQNREPTVHELMHETARKQPFTPVVFQDHIRAVRIQRISGWEHYSLSSPLAYLSLNWDEGQLNHEDEDRELVVTVTDGRVTRNFNPLAVEFRDVGTFTELVYDSLARVDPNGLIPWMAESWSWREDPELSALVSLRDGLRWHDGRRVSSRDIEFTFEFLADTALGEEDMTIPAPRFQGRISLIDSVTAPDESTIRVTFNSANKDVSSQVFTLPILPEHIWEDKTEPAEIAGLSLFEGTTEALVWENTSPVGSGPVQVDDVQTDEYVEFTRFDDHFLNSNPAGISSRFHDKPAFDKFRLQVAPSDSAAFELIETGAAHATADNLNANLVPRIGRNPEVMLKVDRTPSFYLIAYNTRRAPMANPHFRRAVARLIDKEFVSREVFDGFAGPTAVPSREDRWVPSELTWVGEDPVVSFIGTNGELDVARAVEIFREAGYQYNESGELLSRTE